MKTLIAIFVIAATPAASQTYNCYGGPYSYGCNGSDGSSLYGSYGNGHGTSTYTPPQTGGLYNHGEGSLYNRGRGSLYGE